MFKSNKIFTIPLLNMAGRGALRERRERRAKEAYMRECRSYLDWRETDDDIPPYQPGAQVSARAGLCPTAQFGIRLKHF